MSQFTVLFQKELKESVRNLKWVWIPIVFILLGIMEPITTYFLPQILESAGNMPDGAVFQLPEMTPGQIFGSALGQYQFIGMLIIAFAFSGLVAKERKNGTAAFLYVRPLSYSSYILSKWSSSLLLLLASFVVGISASAYYIHLLFGEFSLAKFFGMIGIYSLWIVVALSMTLLMSALFSPGIATALSIFLIVFFPMIDGLILRYWPWTPWKLYSYAAMLMAGDAPNADLWWTIAIAVLLVIVCVTLSILIAKKRAAKVTL